MTVDVHKDKVIVCVWLTQADENDPAVQLQVRGIIDLFKSTKLRIAVYYSGHDDLYNVTLELLRYNRFL